MGKPISKHRTIYCCGCTKDVTTRLTDGTEIYPHRNDLRKLPFWKCDVCSNYVGCHHKTTDSTNPLGCIPTRELRTARGLIHQYMDPIWHSGFISRSKLYKMLNGILGYKYHTADIKSIEEAREVYRAIQKIKGHFDELQIGE